MRCPENNQCLPNLATGSTIRGGAVSHAASRKSFVTPRWVPGAPRRRPRQPLRGAGPPRVASESLRQKDPVRRDEQLLIGSRSRTRTPAAAGGMEPSEAPAAGSRRREQDGARAVRRPTGGRQDYAYPGPSLPAMMTRALGWVHHQFGAVALPQQIRVSGESDARAVRSRSRIVPGLGKLPSADRSPQTQPATTGRCGARPEQVWLTVSEGEFGRPRQGA